jgi:hypothetical protein
MLWPFGQSNVIGFCFAYNMFYSPFWLTCEQMNRSNTFLSGFIRNKTLIYCAETVQESQNGSCMEHSNTDHRKFTIKGHMTNASLDAGRQITLSTR